MSTGRMKITYHPVLKEMRFERYENGRWAEAGDEKSILNKYVIQNDLLLQNLGNQFFRDIAKSMDNIPNVTLDFEGTQEDFKDLERMVKHYRREHEDARCKISVGNLTELPSVKDLFEEVMDYSNETSDAFRQIIEKVKAEGHGEEIYSICGQLEAWLDDLDITREGLKENAVNLCFVGAYSSGKSTLINALIGESILPEAIKSETAKMFKITQISKGSHERPSVSFDLMKAGVRHKVALQWDDKGKISLIGWPQENSIRQAVQCAINESEGKKRHLQMKMILSCINKQPDTFEAIENKDNVCRYDSYVDGIVNVRYPFDLEANVLFHIYDTPGTDSNNPAHVKTLKMALMDPTSSILVYVNDTRLEGSANAVLLDILNSMESQQSVGSSTIDLGRSFFVINRADTVTAPRDLADLQDASLLLRRTAEEGQISAVENEQQGCESVEIKLKEKRLFFTDALHAGDAKAVKKGIAAEAEKERLKDNEKLVNTPWYHLYQYDIMAQAEADTKQLIEAEKNELAELPDPQTLMEVQKSEWKAAYRQAVLEGTEDVFEQEYPMPTKDSIGIPPDAYYICSGVHSLQKEIERYAERYALAVRTKGIIDGTRKLIDKLDEKCEEVGNDLDKDIEVLKDQIKVVTGKLSQKIEGICKAEKHKILSDEEARQLGLDPDAAVSRKKELEKELDKKVKSWAFGNDKELRNSIKAAKSETQKALKRFFDDYVGKSKLRLEMMRDNLIKQIGQAIDAQEELDQDAKERLKRIQKREISRPSQDMHEIDMDDYLWKFAFVHGVKKDPLISDLITSFDAKLMEAGTQYKSAYQSRRDDLANEIQKQYQSRIAEFAGEIKRLEEDRVGVEHELNTLRGILESVKHRDRQLEDKIYNRQLEQEGTV